MRSFLYLDQYKLYSFSSQLFRGLVDHIINVDERKKEREDKPQLGTDTRVVAEIASESSSVAEKRFLHDYAFDLFERELSSRNELSDIDASTTLSSFATPGFVRVSGPAVFADAPRIRDTVTHFNTFVEALAVVTTQSSREKAKKDVTSKISEVADRNVKAQLREQLKKVSARQLAEASGFRQDDDFIKQLSYLLDYGYKEQLQLQIPYEADEGQLLFSAVLNREALRESEALLLQKYSRTTDRPLVVLGVPTQAGGRVAGPFQGGEGTLRGAMGTLYDHLAEIEGTFTGRMEREVVIDPVAVYVEW